MLWYLWQANTFFLHCRCISSQQKYTEGLFNNNLTLSFQFRQSTRLVLPATCVTISGNSPPDRGLLGVFLLTKRHLLKIPVRVSNHLLAILYNYNFLRSTYTSTNHIRALGVQLLIPWGPGLCHSFLLPWFQHMHVFSTCTFSAHARFQHVYVFSTCTFFRKIWVVADVNYTTSCRNWKVKGAVILPLWCTKSN